MRAARCRHIAFTQNGDVFRTQVESPFHVTKLHLKVLQYSVVGLYLPNEFIAALAQAFLLLTNVSHHRLDEAYLGDAASNLSQKLLVLALAYRVSQSMDMRSGFRVVVAGTASRRLDTARNA